MEKVRLTIDVCSFWHPGSGEGAGYGADRTARRDHDGLPFIAGRTLKGILRDAVQRAESLGWYREEGADEPITDTLFGREANDSHGSRPGLLRVGNATLPDEVVTYLGQDTSTARHLRQQLFGVVYSVALDDERGVAKDQALRSIEVVVPLALGAEIAVLPTHWQAQHRVHARWRELLEQALPLVRSVGSWRSRGLGRAALTLEAVA